MSSAMQGPVVRRARRGLGGFVALAVVAGFVALVSKGSADAPTGRYQVTSSLVSDTKTGLIWQRNANATAVDNATAAQYCADLSLGGASDYRLPHVKELLTLVDETRTSPAMDVVAFPDAPAEQFWTNAGFPNSPTSTYTVDFWNGATSGANFMFGSALVRCVRGGG